MDLFLITSIVCYYCILDFYNFQIRSILRNRTTIEDWILEKAMYRRDEQGLPPFVFPYDLGWKKNVEFVYYGSKYDGIRWPVANGCGVYDLTVSLSFYFLFTALEIWIRGN